MEIAGIKYIITNQRSYFRHGGNKIKGGGAELIKGIAAKGQIKQGQATAVACPWIKSK